jgi:hypothetical protein
MSIISSIVQNILSFTGRFLSELIGMTSISVGNPIDDKPRLECSVVVATDSVGEDVNSVFSNFEFSRKMHSGDGRLLEIPVTKISLFDYSKRTFSMLSK